MSVSTQKRTIKNKNKPLIFYKMKNLSYYKSLYKRAKTSKGKSSAMNSAMLNLNYSDQQLFIRFQISTLN